MIAIVMGLGLVATPPDPAWNCEDPLAQQEMNWCAGQEFAEADAALNAQWKLTAALMKEQDAAIDRRNDNQPGYFETLRAAQRAWIIFRDQHCLGESFIARGGSMAPMLEYGCKARLTKERTAELAEMIETE